jgi:hypothetical protein
MPFLERSNRVYRSKKNTFGNEVISWYLFKFLVNIIKRGNLNLILIKNSSQIEIEN